MKIAVSQWRKEACLDYPSIASARKAAALVFAFVAAAAAAAPPVLPPRPVTDSYFGKEVSDPYRFMEDIAAPDVSAWAKAQSEYTRGLLDAVPGRATLLKRLAELDGSVKARINNIRRLPGGVYFYEKRGANDNQYKLYVRSGLKGAERLLVDPEALTRATGSPQMRQCTMQRGLR